MLYYITDTMLTLDIWTFPFLCSRTVLVLSNTFLLLCAMGILQKLGNNESLICVLVKPDVIEMPRVRILNSFSDTPNRQFPVETAVQITCRGEVGRDPNEVRPQSK